MEKLEQKRIESPEAKQGLDAAFAKLPSKFDHIRLEKNTDKVDDIVKLERKVENLPQQIKTFVAIKDLPDVDYCIKDGMKIIDEMYNGKEIEGGRTRGLKQISEMKVNPEFVDQTWTCIAWG